jgi:hypothetical protein
MQARAAAPARSPAARPARPRSAAGEDVGQILRLQQTAGNRAVTRMIQRLDAGDVWDVIKPPFFRPFGILGSLVGGPLENPMSVLAFDAVVEASRRSSRPFTVPAAYFEALEAYALGRRFKRWRESVGR